MDIVTLGAALNGSAEYVNSHFKGGSNIQIVDNPDGTQTINASGEVSSEDTVARTEIAAIKDGETLDSFGDVEIALGYKADSDNVYSKSDVDTALSNKADKITTYTKTEVDAALNAKANTVDVYSKNDVDAALSGKVDKETGKGLSTNDYTDVEKTKLADIEAQANKTTVDDTLSDSSTNPVQNKVVKSSLDSKANASTTYTKTEVDTALGLKQNTISDLSTIRSGAALGATAVQPEAGKGLSSNDYTTAEKTKLDSLVEIKTIGTGLNLDDNGELTATGGGSGGTTNYNDLSNKPQINGSTLSGNKTGAQLGLASTSDIPTTLAELSGDSTHRTVTDTEKATWNAKADVADIPTVPITAIQKNGIGVTPVSGTVNITVPTTAADVSALPDTTKYAAALSLTINSSTFVMTGQLKDQNGDNLGTAQTIDLPLESVVVGGSYNSQTKKVVLTLQNGNTIEFSVADLVSGLQTELSASNKLNPAYINYDSTHRAVSDTEKSTWNGKQNAIDSSHKLSADLVDDTSTTNKFATAAELEQIETNKTNISKLTPTVKDSGNAFTTGSDYTLCDACTLTVPIPSSGVKAAHILVGLAYNSTAPRGIIISLSNNVSDYNTSSKLLAKVESSDYIRLTAECFYYNYGGLDTNIYVWVKSSSSGVNRVVSSMQPLN